MSERLGRFILERKVAAGGMAEVFLAREEQSGGYCVIKKMLPRLMTDAHFKVMFLDEAKLVAQLHHPAIAQVLDFGLDNGTLFLAIEYVPGTNLRTVVKDHKKRGLQIPFDACAWLTAVSARALDYAHSAKGLDGRPLKIIHRDVSPQNVMLGSSGVVKLIDFGVARAESASQKTATGMIKGKFAYMSPEQLRGLQLDGRSDIYGLGLVLYELLAAERAIPGNNDAEIAHHALKQQYPPILSKRADTPPELLEILERALQTDREQRFANAGQMADALEAFVRKVSPAFNPSSLRKLLPNADDDDSQPLPLMQLPAPRPSAREAAKRPSAPGAPTILNIERPVDPARTFIEPPNPLLEPTLPSPMPPLPSGALAQEKTQLLAPVSPHRGLVPTAPAAVLERNKGQTPSSGSPALPWHQGAVAPGPKTSPKPWPSEVVERPGDYARTQLDERRHLPLPPPPSDSTTQNDVLPYPRAKSPLPWILSGAVLVIGVGVLAWAVWSTQKPPPAEPRPPAEVAPSPLAARPGSTVGSGGSSPVALPAAVEPAATGADNANGASANGASANGASANGASANGVSANGVSANGVSANGANANGLNGNGGNAGAVNAGAINAGAVNAGSVNANAVNAGAVNAGTVNPGTANAGALKAAAADAGALAAVAPPNAAAGSEFPGRLRVSSTLSAASVSIDGKVMKAPVPFEVALSAGPHLVVFTDPRTGARFPQSVELKPGHLSVSEWKPGMGALAVRVTPWAEVFIGEKSLGVTPFEKPLRLPVGSYTLGFVNTETHREETRKVTVRANETVTVKVDLRAAQ